MDFVFNWASRGHGEIKKIIHRLHRFSQIIVQVKKYKKNWISRFY
jgi:hypothetical protein